MELIGNLCKLLKGNPTITAKTENRIFPSHLPEGDIFPAMRINLVGGFNPEPSHDSPGVYEALVQIDVYGKALKDIVPIEMELLSSLNGHRGDVLGTDVQGIFIDDVRQSYETEKKVEVISLDFRVFLTIE